MELDFYNNHYVVHFLGSINPYDIELIYKPQKKYFSDEAKNFIETNWKNEIAKNNNAYDGDLFDFISFEKNNDKLKLHYDYTKYRYTRACRSKEYEWFIQQNCYVSNHISIGTIIKTTDNKFLIGSDLRKVDGIQKWKFPGGFWEKCAPTIFDNVKKEINEEIGNIELKNTKVIGMESCNRMSSIITLSEVDMSSKELSNFIIANKNNAVDSHEMSDIKFIDLTKYAINNFLNDKSVKVGSTGAFGLYAVSWWLENKDNENYKGLK